MTLIIKAYAIGNTASLNGRTEEDLLILNAKRFRKLESKTDLRRNRQETSTLWHGSLA